MVPVTSNVIIRIRRGLIFGHDANRRVGAAVVRVKPTTRNGEQHQEEVAVAGATALARIFADTIIIVQKIFRKFFDYRSRIRCNQGERNVIPPPTLILMTRIEGYAVVCCMQ